VRGVGYAAGLGYGAWVKAEGEMRCGLVCVEVSFWLEMRCAWVCVGGGGGCGGDATGDGSGVWGVPDGAWYAVPCDTPWEWRAHTHCQAASLLHDKAN